MNMNFLKQLTFFSIIFLLSRSNAMPFDINNVEAIECQGSKNIVFSTTSSYAQKYTRRVNEIPFSYQIQGNYNVAESGQMKVTGITSNSITLSDTAGVLVLMTTADSCKYKGYLTGQVESGGVTTNIRNHEMNCQIELRQSSMPKPTVCIFPKRK